MHRVAVQAMIPLLWLQAVQLPQPTGLVNDFANVLDAAAEQRMTALIQTVREHSGGEIAVVTWRDLANRPPEELALRLGREWKVGRLADPGDPTRNAGVVILVVPKETNASGRGECRIETGQGTEGFITDGDAGTICREAINYFRNRDYTGGTELIVQRIGAEFANEFGFSLDMFQRPARQPAAGRRTSSGIAPIVVAAVLLVFILMLVRSRRHSGAVRYGSGDDVARAILLSMLARRSRRGWPDGSGHGGSSGGGWSGGGFGGFGGGGFGGFGGGGGFSGGGGGGSW